MGHALSIDLAERHTAADQLERALLGALLVDEAAYLEASDALGSRNPFRSQRHRDVWTACCSLASLNASTDLVSVTQQLREDGALDRVGGAAYLSGLLDEYDFGPISHLAARVIDEYAMRSLVEYAVRLAASASHARGPADEILDKAQAQLLEIAESVDRGDTAELVGVIAARELQRLRDHAAGKRETTGVRSGMRAIDDLLGTLNGGDLILLAARPSLGKSALAVQIADEISRRGQPVLFASLEMGREQLVRRILSRRCRVDLQALMLGCPPIMKLGELTDAERAVRNQPLLIDDRAAQTAIQIRSRARIQQARGGLALIIVDYLQLMGSTSRGFSREQEVGGFSRALKALAKDLHVPVLALAQLNRDAEKQGREPQLFDLRESGSLEQDSDAVLFLHREDRTDRFADLIVAKQRNGPTGRRRMVFDRGFTAFRDLEINEEKDAGHES